MVGEFHAEVYKYIVWAHVHSEHFVNLLHTACLLYDLVYPRENLAVGAFADRQPLVSQVGNTAIATRKTPIITDTMTSTAQLPVPNKVK